MAEATSNFLEPFSKKEYTETLGFLHDICGGLDRYICTSFDARLIMTAKAALFGPFGYGFKDGSRVDAMFTPNTLRTRNARNAGNIASLNCLFVDLDIPEDRYMYLDEAVSDVEDILAKSGIKASYIINSGSKFGLHVYVNFLNKMRATMFSIRLWEKLQKALNALFTDFYADRNVASDCTRILRVPNSINGKHSPFPYIKYTLHPLTFRTIIVNKKRTG